MKFIVFKLSLEKSGYGDAKTVFFFFRVAVHFTHFSQVNAALVEKMR